MNTFKTAVAVPAVSILMPIFNGAAFLAETLDHVLAQTFTDMEIVAVDDGSTDSSYTLLETFARRDSRFRIFRNASRKGLVGNWNECLQMAKGHWIKFVFQDDIILPTCVESMLAAAQNHPGPRRIVFAKRKFAISGSIPPHMDWYRTKKSYWDIFPAKGYLTPDDLLEIFVLYPGSNLFGEPTSFLIERRIFAEIGLFDTELIQLCDLEFWLRAGLRYGLGFINEELVHFRVHGGSETASNLAKRQYITQYLDRLLLHRKMHMDDCFEVARSRVSGWPCNSFFKVQFEISARRARRGLDLFDDPHLMRIWKDVCGRFPELESASKRMYLRLGLEYLASRACVLKRVKTISQSAIG